MSEIDFDGIEYYDCKKVKTSSSLTCSKVDVYETELYTPEESDWTALLISLFQFHKNKLIALKISGPTEATLNNHERRINLDRILE